MGRRPIGVVKDLFRYPVKSMLGERLIEVDIGESGVIGDRAYALREASGRIVTAKKWADMLQFSARYDRSPEPGELASLSITLPDGRTIRAQDPDASSLLSAVLGRKVVLERAQSDQRNHAEIDPATVFGDVPVERVIPGQTATTLPDTFALPPGTFFDSASIHVLASATLAHMRTLIGEDAELDPRRFRPNIVVETAPEAEYFVEDEWLGGTLEVGRSVKIVSMRPALRCVMTTHGQADLARDLRVLRAAAQHHRSHVGVFAAIGAPGKTRLGDPVVLAT
jgi:MOSC domain-containing protein